MHHGAKKLVTAYLREVPSDMCGLFERRQLAAQSQLDAVAIQSKLYCSREVAVMQRLGQVCQGMCLVGFLDDLWLLVCAEKDRRNVECGKKDSSELGAASGARQPDVHEG